MVFELPTVFQKDIGKFTAKNYKSHLNKLAAEVYEFRHGGEFQNSATLYKYFRPLFFFFFKLGFLLSYKSDQQS